MLRAKVCIVYYVSCAGMLTKISFSSSDSYPSSLASSKGPTSSSEYYPITAASLTKVINTFAWGATTE